MDLSCVLHLYSYIYIYVQYYKYTYNMGQPAPLAPAIPARKRAKLFMRFVRDGITYSQSQVRINNSCARVLRAVRLMYGVLYIIIYKI